jgi:hypothetical protein
MRIFSIICLFGLTVFCGVQNSSAKSPPPIDPIPTSRAVNPVVPTFDQYKVETTFRGRAVHIQLIDAKSKRYATMLRRAARQAPNFAGHYVLTSIGCGASCTSSAVIDLNTGTVSWLPFTVCCSDVNVSEPLDYRKNSSLLVIRGSRDENGRGTYYYWFYGKRFLLIREMEHQ